MTKSNEQMHARVQDLMDEIRAEFPGVSDGRLTVLFLERADEDLTRFFIELIADECRRQEQN